MCHFFVEYVNPQCPIILDPKIYHLYLSLPLLLQACVLWCFGKFISVLLFWRTDWACLIQKMSSKITELIDCSCYFTNRTCFNICSLFDSTNSLSPCTKLTQRKMFVAKPLAQLLFWSQTACFLLLNDTAFLHKY